LIDGNSDHQAHDFIGNRWVLFPIVKEAHIPDAQEIDRRATGGSGCPKPLRVARNSRTLSVPSRSGLDIDPGHCSTTPNSGDSSMLATSTPARAVDPSSCLACLASDRPEKRACAAARLLAAGFDLADLPSTAAKPAPVRQ
jgi:hypothetical protein